MRASDVLEVLDLLAAAGVEVWVDGGWNVDALLGAQTRPHNDLDLVIDHVDVDRVRDALTAAGFVAKPSDFATAHTPEEQIDAREVVRCASVFTELARQGWRRE